MLAAEALANALRQNVDIKDIFVDGQETKLLQYADDMTAVPRILGNLRIDYFRTTASLDHRIVPRCRPVEI